MRVKEAGRTDEDQPVSMPPPLSPLTFSSSCRALLGLCWTEDAAESAGYIVHLDTRSVI